jgi:FkbM family methyltransferase
MKYDRTIYINTDLENKSELLKLFSKKDSLVIFDIGGCEGEDSIRYSRLFPNATVYVFEPLPKNQERIIENINNYNANNVKFFPFALSDSKCLSKFYVSNGNPTDQIGDLDWDFGNKSSSLLPPDKHLENVPWIKFDEVIEVETITLDDFLFENEIKQIDFMHMDVQGAELKVLTGATKSLKKIKAIWLEVADITLYKNQPIKKDIEDFMNKNGFYLAKSSLEGKVGDQLYLNKTYFNTRFLNAFSKNNMFYFLVKKLF